MNVTTDLSIISLIANASVLVKGVMLLLAAVSFMSWYWIFRKWFQIRAARAETDGFERDFWSGADLNKLFDAATSSRHQTGGMERIFEAGYREFSKLRGKSHDASATIDGSRRAMRATYQREVDDLEAHLAFLASVGSVSPYVGLFGTVWGIMNAFRAIAGSHDTSLDVVAPGIAEALFATALGLLAAIPAVIGYNNLSTTLNRYATRVEGFADEFSAILSRQLDERAR